MDSARAKVRDSDERFTKHLAAFGQTQSESIRDMIRVHLNELMESNRVNASLNSSKETPSANSSTASNTLNSGLFLQQDRDLLRDVLLNNNNNQTTKNYDMKYRN